MTPNTKADYAGLFSLRVLGWRKLSAAWLSSWTLGGLHIMNAFVVTRLCQHIVQKRQKMIVDTNQTEVVWSDGAILEVGTNFPSGLQELISRPTHHQNIRSFITRLDAKSPQWRDASVMQSPRGDSYAAVRTVDGKISTLVEALYIDYLGQRYPTATIRMRGEFEPIIFVVNGEVRACLMPVKV